MNKAILVVFVIIGIIIFAVGVTLGIFYQIQKDAPELLKAAALEKLSSAVVPSIVAYGQVTSISGSEITLSNAGDSLTIFIASDANVSSFSTNQGSPLEQKVGFAEIKTGDYVNISVKLSSDGQMEGDVVIILPLSE